MGLLEILLLCVLICTLVVYHVKRSYSYWKERNVVYIKPQFPFGSLGNPIFDKKGITVRFLEAYEEIKAKGEKIGGLYFGMKPALLGAHPEIAKTVLHTAFDHFPSQGNTIDEKREPLSAHLLNLSGERWKTMRTKLTPTFTSGKMKMMFQTVLDCGEQFQDYIKQCCIENQSVEIKETLARFTTDVIGSCAFGLNCNSFKNPEAEFRKYGKKIFEPSLKTMLRRFFTLMCPAVINLFKIPLFDTETTEFFMDAIKNIVSYRRTNNITRNDFVQILLSMEEAGFQVEEIAAQAFVFFLAGFETSATTMTFCLYELAYHPEIQDRLREEINCVIKKNNGKLTYEAIMEMNYLDQVINETLRKHPPAPIIKRLCNKDYQLSNGLVIKKGITVFLSVLGLHRDEDYYPHPDRFDPERFSEENKATIPPYGFIPFGEGPRICIGLRFGMLQAKIGLCLLLKDCKVSPHASLKYPIEYEPNSFILGARGPVLLNFNKC